MINPISSVSAVILVGGFGTRLQSVVNDRPKSMATIAGKPFLFYLFEQLLNAGIDHAVLCIGYKAEHIKKLCGDHYKTLSIEYSHEDQPLGTGGAIRLASNYLRSEVLVMNGDSYCEIDLNAYWTWYDCPSVNVGLVSSLQPNTDRYGKIIADPEGKILHFLEKEQNSGTGYINAGIYLMKRSWVKNMSKQIPLSLERDVFPSWIGQGFYMFPTQKRFIDIGLPESYQQAQQFFN